MSMPNKKNSMHIKLVQSDENIVKIREKKLKDTELELNETLIKTIDAFPENKRRSVNKIVKKGDFFNVIYNLNNEKFEIQKSDILIYSSIPYDTSRRYIQRAAVLTMLHPDATVKYLKKHKKNIIKYMELGLKQVGKSKSEAKKNYTDLYKRPLFMMQVLGRMLQHDETGALSANLPGKFLYEINQNTGITGYLIEFLKFLIEATKELPIVTDGESVYLSEQFKDSVSESQVYKKKYLTNKSEVNFELFPESVQIDMQNKLITFDDFNLDVKKPLLRSEFGTAIKNVRKKYVAHSIKPSELEPLFVNTLSTTNNNNINVVSDIHSLDGSLPFQNEHFNILVGDISDSNVSDSRIKGIAVIGNHELSDLIPKHGESSGDFEEFEKLNWYKTLQKNPNDSWPLLPVGNHKFYEVIKRRMSSNFPKMKILNNESYSYKGVKYIGLTIPVALTARKIEVQEFLFAALFKLINSDYQTPTVIISHAPLFNELSLLSPKSKAYNREYSCSIPEIFNLFEKANIIGLIHGHHHIPASKGMKKSIKFAGRDRFVICSIYSKMNTGFPLERILSKLKSNQSTKSITKAKVVDSSKKKEPVVYKYNTPISKMLGISQEVRENKFIFAVDKVVDGKRRRKRFDELTEAIDYLNDLNQEIYNLNKLHMKK